MKKFYKENRIFLFMMGIALLCIAIIAAMCTWYVVSSSSKNVYGNRLDGINDVKFEDKNIKDLKNQISEMKFVKNIEINVHGKIVNFVMDFENDASVAEVQGTSVKCLELIEENYKNFYDIQFLITKSEDTESGSNFPIMGYLKAGNSSISWSRNAKN